MKGMCIEKISGREVLDSRGNPTIEVSVRLCNGAVGRGIAPSGASTGMYEALELRDKDMSRYNGKGVLQCVGYVNNIINMSLQGKDASNIYRIDKILKEIDGTDNKSKLGANCTLAVSIACVRAVSMGLGVPLFKVFGGVSANVLPLPMMNIMNGGAHANNNLDIQEFMIVPNGATSIREAVRWCSQVYQALKEILKEQNLSVSVGDEGGFAPNLENDEQAIKYLLLAIKKAGFEPGKDISLAIDAAASEWYNKEELGYILPKSNIKLTSEQLTNTWKDLVSRYPIISLEDPLGEEDWEGWKNISKALRDKVLLVGDDLFVTNTQRLSQGINENIGNAILIKPNQIGTISETLEAIKLAKDNGYVTIASHRSADTEDVTIADISVGLNMGYIKTGAPARGERVAKYNQLMRIEEMLEGHGKYGLYIKRQR